MKAYLGVGIAAGILAGLWAQFSGSLGLLTWVAFVSWACYFAAGGGVTGLTRTVATNISGVIYGWLMILAAGWIMFSGSLGVSVAVFTLAICLQAAWRPLSFIPGTFAGAACFFGAGAADPIAPAIALIAGALLGIASDVAGKQLQKLFSSAETREPVAETV